MGGGTDNLYLRNMADHENFLNVLWAGSPGDSVAVVSPTDVRNVYQLFRDVQARIGNAHTMIDIGAYQRVCSPGAPVGAVWFRASRLGMITMAMPELLAPWTHDGELDDAVFQAAATFPMKKMQVGVVREQSDFDVEEFLKQIGAPT
jgi:hypothetical protein